MSTLPQDKGGTTRNTWSSLRVSFPPNLIFPLIAKQAVSQSLSRNIELFEETQGLGEALARKPVNDGAAGLLLSGRSIERGKALVWHDSH